MNRESSSFRVPAGLALASAILAAIFMLAGGAERARASDPAASENLRTCGERAFPLSVFNRPAGYQNESTALAALIRREIKEDPFLMPRRGWRLVYKDAEWAELVSGKPRRNGNAWVSYRKVDGKWQGVSYWSNCWFEPAKEGATAGEWYLAKRQKLKPGSTSLRVDVYETECNSGEAAWGRVLAPEIRYRPNSIVVTYFIKWDDLSQAETCPSNPPVPKRLKLAEPLGDRVILDGSRYPYQRRVPGDTQG